MPEAISNASPLIQLAKINQLSLLTGLHTHVLIPEAVHREVVLSGKGRPGASAISRAEADGWLSVATVPNDAALHLLREQIDDGKAEFVRLAMERPLLTILLDDMSARAIARRMGFEVTGTLGVLLRAKQLGFVNELRPLVEELCKDGGFYIAPAIIAQLLATAGE